MIRQIFDAAPAGAINLGLGQPDLGTPETVAEAGVRAIRDGATGYTTTAGLPALRLALRERYEGFLEDPDQIVVTVGSQEAMFAACTALLDPGDELLIPDPAYPAYPAIARLLGATPVRYPLRPERGFRIDPEAVAERITSSTRAVVICEPSNPTGAYSDHDDLERLAGLLAERDVAWISDEIYAAFDYEDAFVSMSQVAPGAGLVVSGLSKELSMTGWRIGWVAGPREAIGRIAALHQYLVTCAPHPSQHAALEALSPRGQAARQQMVQRFSLRRERVGQALASLGLEFVRPRGAFYVFVDVRGFGDCVELAYRLLREQSLVTVPGAAFGPGGAGFLRLSFAADEADLDEGIARLGRALGR